MKFNKKYLVTAILTAFVSACSSSGNPSTSLTGTVEHKQKKYPETTSSNVSVNTLRNKSMEDYNSSQTGEGTKVVIYDTGLNIERKGVKNTGASGKMWDAFPSTFSYVMKEIDAFDSDRSKETFEHGTAMYQIINNHSNSSEKIILLSSNSSMKNRYLSELYKKTNGFDVISNSYSFDSKDVDFFKNLTFPLVDFLKTKKVLWVMATGNDGNDNPVQSNLFPVYQPELESYFLLVGAVENGTTNSIYNKCGIAKDYCIVAEPYHSTYGEKDKQEVSSGTSSATAYVSSIATLIKQRYDWMDGSQLKDVLVTTATDLGEKGNDVVYGVGKINPSKALNGYGRFDKELTFNVEGKKDFYFFDNNISGLGSLVKEGSKTLVLTGDNSYTGKTTINNGTLILDGKNISNIVVNSNGRLAVGDRYGEINSGNVFNYGQLDALTGTDYTIKGSLISTGIINKVIGSKIIVTQNATLSGKFNITGVAKGYVTQDNHKEILLTANKITNNSTIFDITSLGQLVSVKPTVTDNEIFVVTKQKTVGEATALDSKYKGFSTASKTVQNYLNTVDTAYQNGTVTERQLETASSYIQSTNLTADIFENGSETAVHAVENNNVDKINQINRFINYLKASNSASSWVDYQHSQSKLSLLGIYGHSWNNDLSIGGSFVYGPYKFGVSLNNINSNWKESYSSKQKYVDLNGYGIDLGSVVNFNKINAYVSLGTTSLKLKQFGNKASGSQYTVSTGLYKDFIFDKWVISPDISLHYAYFKTSGLKNSSLTSLENLKVKQLNTRLALNTSYFLKDKWVLFGSLGLERDLYKHVNYITSFSGTNIATSSNDVLAKTRGSVLLGIQYKPFENLTLGLNMGYQKGSSSSKKTMNANLTFVF